MKSRAELKAQSAANFKANYWPIVGITVLFTLIIMALAYLGVGFLVVPAFTVGMEFFSMTVYFGDRDNQTFGKAVNVGFEKFGRNLGALLLEGIMLYGWSLLFLIPGIIKAYAYSMTAYILADCPDVDAVDAITISRRMMKGHKWELFVLQLSFLGWNLLSAITFGIVGIFYATPYQKATYAGYYVELKKLCIAQGIVTPEQFAGAPLDGSKAADSYKPVENVTVDSYTEPVYSEPVYSEPVYSEPVYDAPEETVADDNTTETPVSDAFEEKFNG